MLFNNWADSLLLVLGAKPGEIFWTLFRVELGDYNIFVGGGLPSSIKIKCQQSKYELEIELCLLFLSS